MLQRVGIVVATLLTFAQMGNCEYTILLYIIIVIIYEYNYIKIIHNYLIINQRCNTHFPYVVNPIFLINSLLFRFGDPTQLAFNLKSKINSPINYKKYNNDNFY